MLYPTLASVQVRNSIGLGNHVYILLILEVICIYIVICEVLQINIYENHEFLHHKVRKPYKQSNYNFILYILRSLTYITHNEEQMNIYIFINVVCCVGRVEIQIEMIKRLVYCQYGQYSLTFRALIYFCLAKGQKCLKR